MDMEYASMTYGESKSTEVYEHQLLHGLDKISMGCTCLSALVLVSVYVVMFFGLNVRSVHAARVCFS